MKHITLYLIALLCTVAAFADPGPAPAPAATKASSSKAVLNAGSVRFQLNAPATDQDSALVIFDRYDHTGAGVVYQMFAADSTNGISIENVPAGKYYVTVQFHGVHRDRMEMLVRVKAQKNGKVHIKLDDAEVFSKDNVRIPAYNPSFSDLAILKSSK
ncbi:MAG TPA: hypothetical protein VHE34_13945 [Puia sp.]|uniref:hypothetical protein n=1 Tax=Puia sp. TaxID=2045100 RepID=UPI002CD0764D|nr:hypothetical protein [Puia sp.]HVU96326.1 hypothetical protein [Puia sp.]